MTGKPRTCVFLAAAALLACGGDSPAAPAEESKRCQRVNAELAADAFPASFLNARRAALARAVGEGVIVVAAAAGAANPRDDGYRGESSLYYLAGIEIPDAWLVLRVRAGALDTAILFLPEPPAAGEGPSVRELTGVDAVRCRPALSADLRRLMGAPERPLLTVAGNPAADDTLSAALASAGHARRDISYPLAALRVVKDAEEIERMRTAARITAQSIDAAVAAVRAGGNEGDVAAAILGGFQLRGAAAAAFPSIVAAGESALTLHYNANDRPLHAGELILMDVGAEYARYAADVTRTYPVSGRFDARQRALYELVLGAQQAALDAVAPGVTPATLETIARDYLRTRSGGLCGSLACDHYFVHSLWHWLGLNVHDDGPYTTLQTGMVLTLEPGIYLPADRIGIRIEDVILVTASGHEVLSVGAPRTVAEIETRFASAGPTLRPY